MLAVADSEKKVIFQSVHDTFDVDESSELWGSNEPRRTEIIFIGRGLSAEELTEGLQQCCSDNDHATPE